jgi:hypothetical protein
MHKSGFGIGDNKAEIEECQRKIAEVQASLNEVLAKLEAQKAAHAQVRYSRVFYLATV